MEGTGCRALFFLEAEEIDDIAWGLESFNVSVVVVENRKAPALAIGHASLGKNERGQEGKGGAKRAKKLSLKLMRPK